MVNGWYQTHLLHIQFGHLPQLPLQHKHQMDHPPHRHLDVVQLTSKPAIILKEISVGRVKKIVLGRVESIGYQMDLLMIVPHNGTPVQLMMNAVHMQYVRMTEW